jgi:hypothetical protein
MAIERAGGTQHLVTDLARESLQAINRKILTVVVMRANVKREVVLRAKDGVTDRTQELHFGVSALSTALFIIWVVIASCSSPGVGIYFVVLTSFITFGNVVEV